MTKKLTDEEKAKRKAERDAKKEAEKIAKGEAAAAKEAEKEKANDKKLSDIREKSGQAKKDENPPKKVSGRHAEPLHPDIKVADTLKKRAAKQAKIEASYGNALKK